MTANIEDLSTVDPEEVYAQDAELRYLAYASRLRTVIMHSTRYFAYSSDVGEAFRPVVPEWMVKAAYVISWGYVVTDVSLFSYRHQKKVEKGETSVSTLRVGSERAVFQALASMMLPAVTIHSVVTFLTNQTKKSSARVQRIVPTVGGVILLPLLPIIFDEPVEHAVHYVFSNFVDKRMTDSGANAAV